jgi:hypothetical protein
LKFDIVFDQKSRRTFIYSEIPWDQLKNIEFITDNDAVVLNFNTKKNRIIMLLIKAHILCIHIPIMLVFI